jgi:hypothetical protein
MKKEMQKRAAFLLGVSKVRWKRQGEIRSGDFTMHHSGDKMAERSAVIVTHSSIVKSFVKMILCSD